MFGLKWDHPRQWRQTRRAHFGGVQCFGHGHKHQLVRLCVGGLQNCCQGDVSAFELVSFIDLIPGRGCWNASSPAEEEFTKRTNEWTAEMVDPSHSLQPPSFRLSWAFCPPVIDEGGPGGLVF